MLEENEWRAGATHSLHPTTGVGVGWGLCTQGGRRRLKGAPATRTRRACPDAGRSFLPFSAPPFKPSPPSRTPGRGWRRPPSRTPGRRRCEERREGGNAKKKPRLARAPQATHPQLKTLSLSHQLYALLEDRVSRPGYVAALEDARAAAAAATGGEAPAAAATPLADASFWDPPPGAEADGDADATAPLGGPYVMVSRDDAADAMAHFIAAFLATQPDATRLPPAALAAALKTTLHELRRSRLTRLWAWGRWVYRGATVGGAVVGAWTNPWLARAVLAAVWTSAKVVVGLE